MHDAEPRTKEEQTTCFHHIPIGKNLRERGGERHLYVGYEGRRKNKECPESAGCRRVFKNSAVEWWTERQESS